MRGPYRKAGRDWMPAPALLFARPRLSVVSAVLALSLTLRCALHLAIHWLPQVAEISFVCFSAIAIVEAVTFLACGAWILWSKNEVDRTLSGLGGLASVGDSLAAALLAFDNFGDVLENELSRTVADVHMTLLSAGALTTMLLQAKVTASRSTRYFVVLMVGILSGIWATLWLHRVPHAIRLMPHTNETLELALIVTAIACAAAWLESSLGLRLLRRREYVDPKAFPDRVRVRASEFADGSATVYVPGGEERYFADCADASAWLDREGYEEEAAGEQPARLVERA